MASNPVVGIVRKVLGIEGKFLTWLFHGNSAWENWVDETIHEAIRFTARSYVILSWDIANFSYFVASFSQVSRLWIQWVAFERIPRFYNKARAYTVHKVNVERRARVAEVGWLRRYLTDVILRTALTLQNHINAERLARVAEVAWLRRYLTSVIVKTALILQNHINAEIINRQRAINALRGYLLGVIAALQRQVNAIIPFINSQAADGYNATRGDQASIFSKLMDDIAVDNPVVKDVVGKLITLVLDLLSVDDPVARLAASLILRQVIDRLGVDKLAGGLADRLISEFIGSGQVKTLKDVESSVGNRLNNLEGQWQQFYANGGDDIENLGDQMRESASLTFTLPLAAYFAGAVTDPQATATATDAIVTPAAQAIVGPVLALLGGL
jgi:hypothetical protein